MIQVVIFDSGSGKYIRFDIGEVTPLKGGYQAVYPAKGGGAERHIARKCPRAEKFASLTTHQLALSYLSR